MCSNAIRKAHYRVTVIKAESCQVFMSNNCDSVRVSVQEKPYRFIRCGEMYSFHCSLCKTRSENVRI